VLLYILGTSKATAYAPSPTTNFLYGEGEEGSEVFNANNLRPTEEQYAFGKLLQIAMERLFDSLGIIKQKNDHRIYDAEIIELSEETNVILILPPPQRLVQMSENDPDNCLHVGSRNDLMPIGLHTFEVLHLGTYFPRLLENYVKVANQLETETTIVKQLQKETNLPQESDEALSRLNVLSTQQSLLEESWKPVRWLFDILSRFRNRGGASSGITFANLNEWYSKQTDFPDDTVVFANPVTSSATSTNTNNEELLLAKYQSKKSVIVNLSRSPTTRSDPSEFSNESNVTNVTSTSHVTATATVGIDPGSHGGEPNILQVYAAYDTGLASGTSVKLTVTKDTTAREVIDLVIKQLNMAVILKGKVLFYLFF